MSHNTNGEEVLLTVDEDLIAVRFREQNKVQFFASRIEISGEKFTTLNIAETPQPHDIRYKATVDTINVANKVARVAPIFKVGSNYMLATDHLMVGFKPQTENADEILQKHGCKILKCNDEEYLVCLGESEDFLEVTSQLEALQEVNYVKLGLVNFSMPITTSLGCFPFLTSAGYIIWICPRH